MKDYSAQTAVIIGRLLTFQHYPYLHNALQKWLESQIYRDIRTPCPWVIHFPVFIFTHISPICYLLQRCLGKLLGWRLFHLTASQQII